MVVFKFYDPDEYTKSAKQAKIPRYQLQFDFVFENSVQCLMSFFLIVCKEVFRLE